MLKKFLSDSWLVLTMGVAFASLLAFTQTSLSSQIRANQTAALNQAIAEVVPAVDRTEQFTIDGTDVYKCFAADGTHSGWAVDANGGGFIDKIRLVLGLSPDGAEITGLKVVEHIETPGLGNKIEEDWYRNQYPALDPAAPIAVEKRPIRPDENAIQAITGATWTSRYVTDIVNRVNSEIRPQLKDH